MKFEEKWNLDRKPTKRERIFGSVLSAVILVFVSTVFYFYARYFFESGRFSMPILSGFIVGCLVCLGTAVLLYRVAFSKPRKLSRNERLRVGYFFVAFAVVMFLIAFFVDTSDLQARLKALGIGCTGLAGGLTVLQKAKQK